MMTEGLVRMVRLVRMEGGKREDGDKPSYIHLRGGASHRGEGIQIQIQIYIQIQIQNTCKYYNKYKFEFKWKYKYKYNNKY